MHILERQQRMYLESSSVPKQQPNGLIVWELKADPDGKKAPKN